MRSVTQNTAIAKSLGSNAIAPAMALIVSPIIARTLGPYDRGLYAAVAAAASFLGVVSLFGGDDAVVAAASDGTPKRNIARFLTRLIPVASIFTILGVLFFLESGEYELSLGTASVLALSAAAIPIYNICVAWLKSNLQLNAINKALVIPAVLRTILIIIACVVFQPDFVALLVLTFLANLSGVIPVFSHIARRHREPSENSGTPSSLIRRAAVAWPGNLSSLLLLRLDQILGLYLVGPAQLGLYAVAVSVAEIPLVVARAFRNLVYVASAELIPGLLRTAFAAVLLTSTFLALIVGVGIEFAFGNAFAGAVPATWILIVGTIARASSELLGTLFVRGGQLRVNTLSNIGGLVSAIPLMILLRDLGAAGLAFGSACGYATTVLVMLMRRRILLTSLAKL